MAALKGRNNLVMMRFGGLPAVPAQSRRQKSSGPIRNSRRAPGLAGEVRERRREPAGQRPWWARHSASPTLSPAPPAPCPAGRRARLASGRGTDLDNAVGDADGEAHAERDEIADHHGAFLFLRPQDDAASRAGRDLAISFGRLAEREGLFDRRGAVVAGGEPGVSASSTRPKPTGRA